MQLEPRDLFNLRGIIEVSFFRMHFLQLTWTLADLRIEALSDCSSAVPPVSHSAVLFGTEDPLTILRSKLRTATLIVPNGQPDLSGYYKRRFPSCYKARLTLSTHTLKLRFLRISPTFHTSADDSTLTRTLPMYGTLPSLLHDPHQQLQHRSLLPIN